MLEAMDYVLKNPFKYEIFNLGNSDPVVLEDMIKTVAKVVGKEPRVVEKDQRQGEMQLTYANVAKAKKMLNYNPSTTIEGSIKAYYDWFRAQEEWYKKGEY
jgi:UDP-glucuronate 4-epimerase